MKIRLGLISSATDTDLLAAACARSAAGPVAMAESPVPRSPRDRAVAPLSCRSTSSPATWALTPGSSSRQIGRRLPPSSVEPAATAEPPVPANRRDRAVTPSLVPLALSPATWALAPRSSRRPGRRLPPSSMDPATMVEPPVPVSHRDRAVTPPHVPLTSSPTTWALTPEVVETHRRNTPTQ